MKDGAPIGAERSKLWKDSNVNWTVDRITADMSQSEFQELVTDVRIHRKFRNLNLQQWKIIVDGVALLTIGWWQDLRICGC